MCSARPSGPREPRMGGILVVFVHFSGKMYVNISVSSFHCDSSSGMGGFPIATVVQPGWKRQTIGESCYLWKSNVLIRH